MIQLQTVSGFFDTVAEAQQAVQLLLAAGFTGEHVRLETRNEDDNTGFVIDTAVENSNGRFFSALFGNQEETRLRHGHTNDEGFPLSVALVTVRVQSADEAKQVVELLKTAGAENVATDERTNLNYRKVAS